MYTDFLNSRGYSETTRQQYRYVLDRIGMIYDMETLTAEQLRGWLDEQAWQGSMRWQALCAVRAYIRWRYGDQHPALQLRIKRERSGPQRTLTADVARRLLAMFDDSHKGIRDAAIFTLMLDTGLREFEICNLKLKGLSLNSLSLTAKIKGGKTERAIYSAATADRLRSWLAVRGEVTHSPTPIVFLSVGGIRPGTPITPRGLQSIVVGWGRRLGIRLTPHQFRRAFAVISTKAGAPSRLVQLAGRWNSIQMVELYTREIDLEAFRPYSPVSYITDV